MRRQIIADILAEYARKRADALALAEERRAEVADRAPLYADLGAALARLMAECARDGEPAAEKVRVLRGQAEAQLHRAGCAPEDLAPRYDCPDCRDTGYVGEPVKRFCACFERRVREEAVQRSGLSSVPSHTFAHFDASVFSDAARDGGRSQRAYMERLRGFCAKWAETFPGNAQRDILLCGKTGLGKTFLLDCVAARIMERGYTVLRITAFRLLEAMRLRHFGRDESGLMEAMLTSDLLYIDDLGIEPLFENISVEYLFTVLNERRQSGLSTLIATNLHPEELRERYSERVASRLLDTENCARFLLSGDDIRLRKEREAK